MGMGTLVIVAGSPGRTMVKYMVPEVDVVVPGTPLAGRFDRVLIHSPALVGLTATREARQAWFDDVAARLTIGGETHQFDTMAGIVDDLLAMREVAGAVVREPEVACDVRS